MSLAGDDQPGSAGARFPVFVGLTDLTSPVGL